MHTAQEEGPPSAAVVYYFLLAPGVRLLFYPSAYCVQSDGHGRMLETLTRGGNGTAAILLIVGLAFWILREPLEGSRWNLYHHPFAPADADESIIHQTTTFYNRVYLLVGAVVARLFGWVRLQQRERFV